MKRLLSIIGAISLVGTSTTSLVACNKPQEYTLEELVKLKEENKITTKNGVLEWIAPQEKPFNKVDNKYYYVVWRGNKNDKWRIIKLKHIELKIGKIFDKYNNYTLELREESGYPFNFTLYVRYSSSLGPADWESYHNKGTFFKAVYRWNLDTQEPHLILDENGNVKVNGE
ncbi:MAG: hypothetical protein SPLM_09210 [Spiroplasma phoeniceum]|uniref:lipoprotein n=1 Tax=Spiroplasma phoeniceum TaxID=47835 RepID=UPI003133E8D8